MKTITGLLTFCLFAAGAPAVPGASDAEGPASNQAARRALEPQPQNSDADRLAQEEVVRAQDEAERQKGLLRLEQQLIEKQRKEKADDKSLAAPASDPEPLQLAQQSPPAPVAVPVPPANAVTPASQMTPEQEAAARALLRQTATNA